MQGFLSLLVADICKNGDPSGIRTRVAALKGLCPGPLDDGTAQFKESGESCGT